MLGNSVVAPRTVQSALTKHTAPGTSAWPGSGSARTRCVSWRPGHVTASTTVVIPRTKTSAVSLALPLLLKRKVVREMWGRAAFYKLYFNSCDQD